MSAAPPTVLRVLVADDHRLMLSAVRRALGRSDRLEVVGEVDEAMKVIPAVGELEPDVVLLDIRMPDLDGLTCLERLKRHHPEVAVVILSTFAGDDYVEAARARGAEGYIVKTVDPLGLPAMVCEAVASPEFVLFRPEIDEPVAEPQDAHGLSEREVAIVRAVSRGLTNKEIGRELFVSEQTVKFHLRNIYRKLEIGSRAEAARWAIENGLAGASTPSAGG
ncbi:MAG TPA: response regulator transcription factor [Gaiellaceae bacterium]|nr:response regulator transcription factor [Gaiellaceae bacterium]